MRSLRCSRHPRRMLSTSLLRRLYPPYRRIQVERWHHRSRGLPRRSTVRRRSTTPRVARLHLHLRLNPARRIQGR